MLMNKLEKQLQNLRNIPLDPVLPKKVCVNFRKRLARHRRRLFIGSSLHILLGILILNIDLLSKGKLIGENLTGNGIILLDYINPLKWPNLFSKSWSVIQIYQANLESILTLTFIAGIAVIGVGALWGLAGLFSYPELRMEESYAE
jgi:hypothetical protein